MGWQWSNNLICTLTWLVQVRAITADRFAQSTKIDLRTFLEGVWLSQLFPLFDHKQTNSNTIDRPNQSIKLSESRVASLLNPILFLPREATPRETFFPLMFIEVRAKICVFMWQSVEDQTMEALFSIFMHQIRIWSIRHFELNYSFCSLLCVPES